MAFDFPNTPTDGQQFSPAGGPDYVWSAAAGAWLVKTGGTSSSFVAKSGDVMTGHLGLPVGPAAANATRKDYVDAGDASAVAVANGKVAKGGDTMTGPLVVPSLSIGGVAAYGNIPVNIQATGYAPVAADASKCIRTTGTMPVDGTLFPINTVLTVVAWGGVLTISNNQTMYLSGSTGPSSGNRTLINLGVATLFKVDAATWIISGSGLT